ncbi:MAG: hypothetical protein D6785_07150, partial [Planctomycetota bacterium]
MDGKRMKNNSALIFFILILMGMAIPSFFLVQPLLGAHILLRNGHIIPGRILKRTKKGEVILLAQKENTKGRIIVKKEDIRDILPEIPFSSPNKSSNLLNRKQKKEQKDKSMVGNQMLGIFTKKPRKSRGEASFPLLRETFLQSLQALPRLSQKVSKKRIVLEKLHLSFQIPRTWKIQQGEESFYCSWGMERMVFFSMAIPKEAYPKILPLTISRHKERDACLQIIRIQKDQTSSKIFLYGKTQNFKILYT